MDNICLIIQGPSVNVNILKDKYKNMNIQIIFSTWEGEESKYNEIIIPQACCWLLSMNRMNNLISNLMKCHPSFHLASTALINHK